MEQAINNIPFNKCRVGEIIKNTTRDQSVSDREILTIIKEEKRLPVAFSKPIKLSVLTKYYYKYWNNDFTDEESDTDEL